MGVRIPTPQRSRTASTSTSSRSAASHHRYAELIDVDDLELVTRARSGDRGALEILLGRHYDALHGVCRRIAGNDADADDATQEALIAIVRGLDRFAGGSRFSTWAYRVAVNACLDELRRRRRRPEPIELPEASTPASDDHVIERLDIDAALTRLPLDFRAAVVLRDLCALDYADIAAVLDIPIGTVRSRIARGRAALVPLLRPDPGNPHDPGNPAGTLDRPTLGHEP